VTRTALIGNLFYLLTITFEDGAALATDGQRTTDAERLAEIGRQIHDKGQAIVILSETIRALGNQ
jgi:hypothetical protein